MISKTRAKLIRSLDRKKIRDRERLFLVEGGKMVSELLNMQGKESPRALEVIATEKWLRENHGLLAKKNIPGLEADEKELRQLSHLVNPQEVMVLAGIPERKENPSLLAAETILGFEAIRDPGNLGTIIRTAEWFGIRHIVCSPDSVDAFNPKVVQSTMGALFRVEVHYMDLEKLLGNPCFRDKAVYGTFLRGKNLYETRLEKNPMIVFGNESRGLSESLSACLKAKITIPSFAEGKGSESLNLASSVAIVCSEFRRPSNL